MCSFAPLLLILHCQKVFSSSKISCQDPSGTTRVRSTRCPARRLILAPFRVEKQLLDKQKRRWRRVLRAAKEKFTHIEVYPRTFWRGNSRSAFLREY